MYVEVNNDKIACRYEKKDNADVIVKLSHEVLSNIIKGRLTFQRAFMTGEMKAKGNFKTLRMLDELFNFSIAILNENHQKIKHYLLMKLFYR